MACCTTYKEGQKATCQHSVATVYGKVEKDHLPTSFAQLTKMERKTTCQCPVHYSQKRVWRLLASTSFSRYPPKCSRTACHFVALLTEHEQNPTCQRPVAPYSVYRRREEDHLSTPCCTTHKKGAEAYLSMPYNVQKRSRMPPCDTHRKGVESTVNMPCYTINSQMGRLPSKALLHCP